MLPNAPMKLGGGVQGQKSWKHDFEEVTGDPKGSPSGSTILVGF